MAKSSILPWLVIGGAGLYWLSRPASGGASGALQVRENQNIDEQNALIELQNILAVERDAGWVMVTDGGGQAAAFPAPAHMTMASIGARAREVGRRFGVGEPVVMLKGTTVIVRYDARGFGSSLSHATPGAGKAAAARQREVNLDPRATTRRSNG